MVSPSKLRSSKTKKLAAKSMFPPVTFTAAMAGSDAGSPAWSRCHCPSLKSTRSLAMTAPAASNTSIAANPGENVALSSRTVSDTDRCRSLNSTRRGYRSNSPADPTMMARSPEAASGQGDSSPDPHSATNALPGSANLIPCDDHHWSARGSPCVVGDPSGSDSKSIVTVSARPVPARKTTAKPAKPTSVNTRSSRGPADRLNRLQSRRRRLRFMLISDWPVRRDASNRVFPQNRTSPSGPPQLVEYRRGSPCLSLTTHNWT